MSRALPAFRSPHKPPKGGWRRPKDGIRVSNCIRSVSDVYQVVGYTGAEGHGAKGLNTMRIDMYHVYSVGIATVSCGYGIEGVFINVSTCIRDVFIRYSRIRRKYSVIRRWVVIQIEYESNTLEIRVSLGILSKYV